MSKVSAIEVIKESPHFKIPTLKQAAHAAQQEIYAGKKEPEALTAAQMAVIEKARECQLVTVEGMLKYFELCQMLRQNRFPPKVARALLFSVGMAKTRVSELLTVVDTSDRIFKDYANRAIGFKLALAQAREEKDGQKDLLPSGAEYEAELAPVIAKALGNKKRAAFEIAGVKVIFVRTKPPGETGADGQGQPDKAKPTRKKKE